MDPADHDAVYHTLEVQGRLLGHHDQVSLGHMDFIPEPQNQHGGPAHARRGRGDP